ncbi:MAG: sulfite exporter TauE/SafE family protein [Armatimonadetes bacterium]|nr:sulfite exporter TauE/SafE family protein [Armatimonadota bacterium]
MLLLLLVAAAAAVYSSVGHGGASAYLGMLSLYGVPPREMSTSALLLNVLVAGIATVTYARAGHLSARLAWPFMVTSVPLAYLGGLLHVAPRAYTLLLGVALLGAALRLWWTPSERPPKTLALPVALVSGAGIGILSGIVGVGGGIFLSPLMILAGWAGAKQTAAVSAAFIVVNSIAGLAGRAARGALVVGDLGPLVIAAFLGGLVGSRLGAHRLLPVHIRRVLAVTLLFVAFKNLWIWLGSL